MVTVSVFTAALLRQWLPAVASAGVLIWVVGPGLLAESERAVSTVSVDGVVIVSSNVRAGNEHIGELVEQLIAQGPDIIVLQEIEGSGLEAIRNTGISTQPVTTPSCERSPMSDRIEEWRRSVRSPRRD